MSVVYMYTTHTHTLRRWSGHLVQHRETEGVAAPSECAGAPLALCTHPQTSTDRAPRTHGRRLQPSMRSTPTSIWDPLSQNQAQLVRRKRYCTRSASLSFLSPFLFASRSCKPAATS